MLGLRANAEWPISGRAALRLCSMSRSYRQSLLYFVSYPARPLLLFCRLYRRSLLLEVVSSAFDCCGHLIRVPLAPVREP